MPGPAVSTYLALALQVPTHPVAALRSPEVAREAIRVNIASIASALSDSVALAAETHGLPVRLVVLPEYVLTGAPGHGSFTDWRALACLEPDGAEYRTLGGIARDGGFYLAGNAYEADPHFPDLYFQCSFVLDPDGDIVLRYRRLISLYSPSPYDVWDRYLQIYGLEGVYPVAETAIGRLAAVASEEILYPEIARCHVLRGGEILLHSTSEMGSPQSTAKELARRARAAENLAYVVSANTAGVPGTGLPSRSSTGMSKILDWDGRILAQAVPGGATMAAVAPIDIEGLRARRRQAGLANPLSRLPLQAFATSYEQTRGRACNELEPAADASRSRLLELQSATIRRLAADRLL
jgi:predicted amidohydrolase